MPNGTFKRLALCGLLLALSACEAPAPKPDQQAGMTSGKATLSAEINDLLAKSANSQSPEKEYYLLEAAKALHSQNKTAWARNLLASIDSDLLSDTAFIDYTLIYSDISLRESSLLLAQRLLTPPRLEQLWKTLPKDTRLLLRQRRVSLYDQLGKSEASINEKLAMEAAQLVSGNQQNALIWSELVELSTAELQQKAATAEDDVMRGWYALATLAKTYSDDLETEQAAVNDWLLQWPNHPAANDLPLELRQLATLIANRPQRIAILLPQQGELEKASEAIRNGFLASFYLARERGNHIPQIRFYDSGNGDILATYHQAVTDGAQLIIGPLEKDAVDMLSSEPALPVPTLAVNYSKLDATPGTNLFQFGLAIEDEARQAARRAWLEGYRHPVILAADANWAQRSAEAFAAEWRAQGGDITLQRVFHDDSDFSKLIASTLLIDQSQQRANALRRLLGRNVDFEPRRRQDIDMMYLAATPVQGRQIKPMLAFHYASDLPVIASSQIYSGTPDPKRDMDLNDIQFSSLPWVFSKSPVRQQIDRYSKPVAAYQPLYALGADTFQLYQRLPLLQLAPDQRLHGNTGILSLEPNNRIRREQVWTVIDNGKAVAVSTSPRVLQ